MKIADVSPHHVLTADELSQIESLVPLIRESTGANTARLIEMLINNVRNSRIALHAAVERIGLVGFTEGA